MKVLVKRKEKVVCPGVKLHSLTQNGQTHKSGDMPNKKDNWQLIWQTMQVTGENFVRGE